MVLPLKLALPFEGCAFNEYVNTSPSISSPLKYIRATLSSTTVTDCVVAVGASLTLLTVIDTVVADEVALPSDAVNVKLSEPL